MRAYLLLMGLLYRVALYEEGESVEVVIDLRGERDTPTWWYRDKRMHCLRTCDVPLMPQTVYDVMYACSTPARRAWLTRWTRGE